MTGIPQRNRKLFSSWVQTAQEYSEGKKSFLDFAKETLKTSSVLVPDPAGKKHHVWIPLKDIMESAKTLSPKNIEHGLLAVDSITMGYPRFFVAGSEILEYGCKQGMITVHAAWQILGALRSRRTQINPPAP